MGIDLDHRKQRTGRKAPISKNIYLLILVKLYRFLCRRAESPFNKAILKRLITTRINRQALSLQKIQKFVNEENATDRIIVNVGNVIDSYKLDGHAFPALRIAALRFSKSARARIIKNGGECISFDQLALLSPKGNGCALLRGSMKLRKQTKFFGPAPGEHGSKTPSKTRSKGRKFECGPRA